MTSLNSFRARLISALVVGAICTMSSLSRSFVWSFPDTMLPVTGLKIAVHARLPDCPLKAAQRLECVVPTQEVLGHDIAQRSRH